MMLCPNALSVVFEVTTCQRQQQGCERKGENCQGEVAIVKGDFKYIRTYTTQSLKR